MRVDRLAVLVGVSLLAAMACKGTDQAAGPAQKAASPGLRVDDSKTGTVKGRVILEGTPSPNAPIQMSADPVCARANEGGVTTEAFLVKDGGLENVFVYVKTGMEKYGFDAPGDPVKLDQVGCRYTPRVFGVRVGQPLEIANSDPTLHNVHLVAKANDQFNFPQYVKGQTNRKTFDAKEVMVRFQCDVHPWMRSYAGVLDHPYFAVSANGGQFELKNVPAGTYTVEAWHERLGTKTQEITIGEKESRDVTFTFTPSASTN